MMSEQGKTSRALEQMAEVVHSAEAQARAKAVAGEGKRVGISKRIARVVAPFAMSFAGHVILAVIVLLVAGTAVLLHRREDSPVVTADFNALTYDPVKATQQNAESKEKSALADEPLFKKSSANEPVVSAADLSGLTAPAAGHVSAGDFAPSPGGGDVEFIGLKTSNARRIVYVIDASGSMIAHLPFVVNELVRSMSALNEQQSFGVVFFQGNKAKWATPENSLMKATKEEKSKVEKWIKDTIIPRGRSNPLEALRGALRLKPDVIFLLSTNITGSGEFEIDQKDLLAQLDELNPVSETNGRRPVQINCVQFLDPDPLGTLAKIAEAHGGKQGYRFVSRQDLGLDSP
ncbi:MAG TPA: hypothetical protein VG711_01185 [Phycisphaerales bacterium]|nr:hypothetical protein [Phycisphaerales bacterium]